MTNAAPLTVRMTRALGSPAVAQAAPPATTAKTDQLQPFFVAYMVLVAIEYGGLYTELPLLRTLYVASFLRWALLLLMVRRVTLAESVKTSQLALLIGMWCHTVLSVVYAEIQIRAYIQVRPFFLSVAFAFVTAYLMDRRSRVDKLALLFAPIAVMLLAKNFGRLGASRAGGLNAPFFMGDRNDFAWAMLVMMPIIAVLLIGRRGVLTRALALAGIAAGVVGVVFSQSRGGAIGLVAVVLYGWLIVSKRRILGLGAVLVVGLGVYIVAPSGYFERMETVATYEEDNSAQGRLEAWTRATQMALDYPLGVGAGNFPSSYGRHYIDVDSTRIWYGARRWINAHSIYFRVLGEYGFIGLTMLLWIIVGSIRDNIAVARVLQQHPDPPLHPRWPALVNMSIVGFAVAGLFLGGFDFPHLFLLAGLTIANRRVAANIEAARTQTVGRETPASLSGRDPAACPRGRAHADAGAPIEPRRWPQIVDRCESWSPTAILGRPSPSFARSAGAATTSSSGSERRRLSRKRRATAASDSPIPIRSPTARDSFRRSTRRWIARTSTCCCRYRM